MQYIKKPIQIEAFQIDVEPLPDWIRDAEVQGIIKIQSNWIDGVQADIETLEGVMHADAGDFIIRGVNGEIYPCKPDIFEKTYEKVGENYNGKRRLFRNRI